MNEKNWNLSSNFVSSNYLNQAQQANHQRENLITALLSQVRERIFLPIPNRNFEFYFF